MHVDQILKNQKLPDFFQFEIENSLQNISISLANIERTWEQVKKNPLYVKFKIIHSELFSQAHPSVRCHPRYLIVERALKQVLKPFFCEFILYLGDALNVNPHPAPIFAFSTIGIQKNVILIPDCEALNPFERNYIKKNILNSERSLKWTSKKKQIFWRGSSTGPQLTDEQLSTEQWTSSPRFFLVVLSKKCPQILNASFTKIVQNPHENIKELFSISPSLPPKKHLFFRYLIDVDGNSCCYSRTYWILLSNSLMLKQISCHRQWFYRGLVPYQHFIPVAHDLSNLCEQYHWCVSHDETAHQISQNATHFALNYLGYESNLCYFEELLKSYARLQNFEPQINDEDCKIPLRNRNYLIYYLKRRIKKLTNLPIA